MLERLKFFLNLSINVTTSQRNKLQNCQNHYFVVIGGKGFEPCVRQCKDIQCAPQLPRFVPFGGFACKTYRTGLYAQITCRFLSGKGGCLDVVDSAIKIVDEAEQRPWLLAASHQSAVDIRRFGRVFGGNGAGQVVDGVNGFIYNDGKEMYALMKRWQSMSHEERERFTASVVNSVKAYSCKALAEYLVGIYEKAIREKAEQI